VTPERDEWVAIALLGKPRGNRGELTAVNLSHKPERFAELREVFLLLPGKTAGERLELESTWFHDGRLILKFAGVDTIADAERWVGAEVRIPFSQRAAPEPGAYFQSELIGCEVVERAGGEPLGRVVAWDDGGGNGLLVLDSGLMIPFAREICVEIDPAARRIAVELPPGLKELNRP
jgi:16S rRNA processing protein RimM